MRCPCCGKPHRQTYEVVVERVVRMRATVEVDAEDFEEARTLAEADATLGQAHWEETSTVDQTVLRTKVMS